MRKRAAQCEPRIAAGMRHAHTPDLARAALDLRHLAARARAVAIEHECVAHLWRRRLDIEGVLRVHVHVPDDVQPVRAVEHRRLGPQMPPGEGRRRETEA